MGLIGNGFRHSLTGKLFGGTAIDGGNPSVMVYWGHRAATNRNQFAGEAIQPKQASIPSGARHPYVWVAPQIAGAIKSYRRADAVLRGSAAGELGFTRTGGTSVALEGAATAGLIVGATGTATVSVDGQAVIVASLNVAGSVAISVSAVGVLGAIASLNGMGAVTLDGDCHLMGVGYVTGTTEEAGLTPAGIARAVWTALLTQYQGEGTAGKALSAASSGGVDYQALGQAVVAALNAAQIPVDVKAVNGVTVAGAGKTGDPWGPA